MTVTAPASPSPKLSLTISLNEPVISMLPAVTITGPASPSLELRVVVADSLANDATGFAKLDATGRDRHGTSIACTDRGRVDGARFDRQFVRRHGDATRGIRRPAVHRHDSGELVYDDLLTRDPYGTDVIAADLDPRAIRQRDVRSTVTCKPAIYELRVASAA